MLLLLRLILGARRAAAETSIRDGSKSPITVLNGNPHSTHPLFPQLCLLRYDMRGAEGGNVDRQPLDKANAALHEAL